MVTARVAPTRSRKYELLIPKYESSIKAVLHSHRVYLVYSRWKNVNQKRLEVSEQCYNLVLKVELFKGEATVFPPSFFYKKRFNTTTKLFWWRALSFINVKVIKFVFSSKSLVFILYFGMKAGLSIYVSPGRLLHGKIKSLLIQKCLILFYKRLLM